MKTIFVRDEIVPGVNDRCRVVPAGGADQRKAAGDTILRTVRIMDKLDRVIELMQRSRDIRNRPIPDAPDAGPGLAELVNQYPLSFADMSRVSAEEMARRCAESQAAYAARNPHTQENVR